MESNRRVSGFVKGKLMPLYRLAKPSSTTMQYGGKVKPSLQSSSATASVGFQLVHHHQDYVISQPKQKVSFIVPSSENNNNVVVNNQDKYLSQLETIFGVAGDDEGVDIKAASYISSVQERFKLERQ